MYAFAVGMPFSHGIGINVYVIQRYGAMFAPLLSPGDLVAFPFHAANDPWRD